MTRILVIEDEADIRLTLRMYLEMASFEIEEAASGEEGLERLLAGDPPAAILLDLRLPGMDGLELLRRIREQERLGSVPILAISAHAGGDIAEEAIALGVAGYLTKPFRLAELKDALERVIQPS